MAAEYTASSRRPTQPATAPSSTTRPRPAVIMVGSTSRTRWSVALRSRVSTRSMSVCGMAAKGPVHPMPAPATRTSIRPVVCSADWASRRGPPGAARSAGSTTAEVPDAVCSRRCRSRPFSSNCQPSIAKRRAVAAPMPEEAPVTRATRRSSRRGGPYWFTRAGTGAVTLTGSGSAGGS